MFYWFVGGIRFGSVLPSHQRTLWCRHPYSNFQLKTKNLNVKIGLICLLLLLLLLLFAKSFTVFNLSTFFQSISASTVPLLNPSLHPKSATSAHYLWILNKVGKRIRLRDRKRDDKNSKVIHTALQMGDEGAFWRRDGNKISAMRLLRMAPPFRNA